MNQSTTQELIEKIGWIFRLIDVTYLLRNEPFDDRVMRSIMRMMVIQVDNLLKIVGQLKNNLHRERKIDLAQKQEVEAAISTLSLSHDNAYDLIRDKVSAHAQPVDLLLLMDWWGSFDYTAIEVMYGDCKTIQSYLEAVDHVTFLNVPDYCQIIQNTPKPSPQPSISMSRFALAEPNTVALVACHSSQEKAQTIASLADLLMIDFSLSELTDNPSSIFRRLVFDIAWMLVVIDLCSLIDNLFVDSHHDSSLMTYWENDFGGHTELQRLNQLRNLSLEVEIRDVRNTFAAHIDATQSLTQLYDKFETLNLQAVHAYACDLVNGFFEACRRDIRTKMFAVQRSVLNEVIAVKNPGKPFDN